MEDTLACLESLSKIDYLNYRIILVDNGSTDGSIEEIPEKFPNIIFLKNGENLGFAEGNNVGIRYALSQEFEYIMLLNNDTVVDSSFLSELVFIAQQHDNIGMLSPLIYWYHAPEKLWFYRGAINWENGSAGHPETPKDLRVEEFPKYLRGADFLSGCAILVKAEVIRKIGLLDKRFFIYYEDVDWCVRCRKAGWEFAVVPSSKIWHKVTSSDISDYNSFLCYRNVILFLWKHSNLLQFLLRVKRHIYRTLAEYSWSKETYFSDHKITWIDGVWAGITGHYGKEPYRIPEWGRRFLYRYIRYLLWIFRYPK